MRCSSSLHETPTSSVSCFRNHCLIVLVATAKADLLYFRVKQIDSMLS